MAVFEKFKQWVEKALEKSQPNDEKVLDEQYQEQLDIESPREELFKQNILMGDTSRSEIVGEDNLSEQINVASEEDIADRNVDPNSDIPAEQNNAEFNIPAFLNSDNDSDAVRDVNITNPAVEPTDDGTASFANNLDATEFNPAPVPNDFESSFSAVASNDLNDDLIPDPNPDPDPDSSSDVSPVVDSDAASNTVNESANVGDSVGVTAFAEDLDIGDDVTYSLSNNPGNAFAIDATTGEVTVNDPSALDFETAPNMSIEVTATSDDGSSSSATFNISISDDNSEFSIGPIVDINEGTSNQVIWSENFDGLADGTQADTGDTSWSVDESNAVVTGNHGVNNDAYEFSQSYSAGGTQGNLVWQSESIDISNAENMSLSLDISSIGSLEDSGSAQDSIVVIANVDGVRHTLLTDDGNVDGGPNFSFSSIPEGSSLIIEVESMVSFNTETYQIDNIELSGDVTSAESNNSVSELASVGDSVGITAFAEDLDASDSVAYSLSINPNNAFAIDANTGEVTVADPRGLDFETASSMQIEVTATSTDGSTSNASFDIAITDANEGGLILTTDSSGNEDSAIALDIQVSNVELGAAVAVTIGAVPIGAVLSAGTDNGDGTWTLDQSDLSGLTITPPAHSDDEFTLTVQTDITENGVTQSYNNSIDVTVDAVVDAPSLVVNDADGVTNITSADFEIGSSGSGFESGPINGWSAPAGHEIEVWHENDQAGEAAEGDMFIELNNEGSGTYSDAGLLEQVVSTNTDTAYELSFQVSPRPGFESYMDFNVNVIDESTGNVIKTISIDWDGNTVSELTWQSHSIQFVGTGGDVRLQFEDTGAIHAYGRGAYIDDIEFNESSGYVAGQDIDLSSLINASLVDTDGSESLAIELTGIPTGAELASGGSSIAIVNGVAQVDTSQLSSLTFNMKDGFTGDVHIGVNVTSTESSTGDTATVSDTLSMTIVSNDENFDALGSSSNDNISGTSSADTLYGGAGSDTIRGDAGDDTIYGGSDNDSISGDAGQDSLFGGDGNDRMSGGDDADLIFGGEGNDFLRGDDGDDHLYGGAGDDTLQGNDGNDLLIGGAGDDIAVGGAGDDVYIFEALGDSDSFSGGDGGGWTDVIELNVDIASQPDPDNPWTITVGGNQVNYDVEEGFLDIGSDVSGVITFDDGSEITFDGVEQIQW